MENNTTTNGTTAQAATAPATQTPSQTAHAPAAQVDVDSIVSKAEAKAVDAAEKKMEAVFKSMLQQQGLDADTIAKMTNEWKSKQVTPEQQLQEKDTALTAEKAKNETLHHQIAALGKGVPADKMARYIKLAESYTDEKTGFEAALDLAIADFPFTKTERPPVYAAGTGSTSMLGDEDEITKRIAKYKK